MTVGMWLQEEKSSLKMQEVAKMLKVSRRTLSNWKKQAGATGKKLGRPKKELCVVALLKVGREWKKQGRPGWRPVAAALKGVVSTRRVQAQVARLKFLERSKFRRRIINHRVSIKVRHKNTYWSQDGTEYKKKKYQIIKDRGSKKLLLVQPNAKETSSTAIKTLEAARESRGLPLVLGTDNGSCYTSKSMKRYLAKNKVIHLRSLPRTPEHNGAVECAIREIKEVASKNGNSLKEAGTLMNKNRLRASLLFETSDEIDGKMGLGYTETSREHFYKRCKQHIKNSCADATNDRSKRLLERKAILETLEQFGLIDINRGKFA